MTGTVPEDALNAKCFLERKIENATRTFKVKDKTYGE
jgi:hypothetical protein